MHDRLAELEGRLKAALLAARVPAGYDRNGSHDEGRYIEFQCGLEENVHLLQSNPHMLEQLSERLVERLLADLSVSDLLLLIDLKAAIASPEAAEVHELGEPFAEVGTEDAFAEQSEDPAGEPISWPVLEIDRLALQIARERYDAAGWSAPRSLRDVKAAHWRRLAMRRWAESRTDARPGSGSC